MQHAIRLSVVFDTQSTLTSLHLSSREAAVLVTAAFVHEQHRAGVCRFGMICSNIYMYMEPILGFNLIM